MGLIQYRTRCPEFTSAVECVCGGNKKDGHNKEACSSLECLEKVLKTQSLHQAVLNKVKNLYKCSFVHVFQMYASVTDLLFNLQ